MKKFKKKNQIAKKMIRNLNIRNIKKKMEIKNQV